MNGSMNFKTRKTRISDWKVGLRPNGQNVRHRLPFFKRINIQTSSLFYLNVNFLETCTAHLFYTSTGRSLPSFGEERCPGGEVLFELRVGLVLAAVAAAGRASPGHLEGRGFIRAATAALVFNHDYDETNLTLKKVERKRPRPSVTKSRLGGKTAQKAK